MTGLAVLVAEPELVVLPAVVGESWRPWRTSWRIELRMRLTYQTQPSVNELQGRLKMEI